jgi:hypothetical protein
MASLMILICTAVETQRSRLAATTRDRVARPGSVLARRARAPSCRQCLFSFQTPRPAGGREVRTASSRRARGVGVGRPTRLVHDAMLLQPEQRVHLLLRDVPARGGRGIPHGHPQPLSRFPHVRARAGAERNAPATPVRGERGAPALVVVEVLEELLRVPALRHPRGQQG